MNSFIRVFNDKFLNGSNTHRRQVSGLMAVEPFGSEKFASLLDRLENVEKEKDKQLVRH